ncbi:MAG: NAD(P)/FAD-dependent oxidoreductase [Patescibacteria group bacterium]|nr:NAD(P)/FAD-dependent oxidoreductase [Patescibacteria group bacterium]
MLENKNNYDAIIVGAGISGILSALILSKNNKKLLVIEKDKNIGGNCRTYEIDGYHFDTGPHSITGLKNGPLRHLIDNYFSSTPSFVPIKTYYVRHQNKFQQIPLTLSQLSRFSIFSKKDRIYYSLSVLDAIINSSINKSVLEKDVYSYIKKYKFSNESIKFIDVLSYFLSGKSMKETPTWRILGGSGYIDENEDTSKQYIKKLIKLLKHDYSSQGYPLGGIQSITSSAIDSIPENKVTFKTGEKVLNFIIKNKQIKGVKTDKDIYHSNLVIYSGFVKDLPDLISNLEAPYKNNLQNIKQTKSLTLWLGLKKKIPELNYNGTEIYFNSDTPYWAMPVSNFDANLAPKNKQLVGFTTILKKDREKQIEDLKQTIFKVFPNIKNDIEIEHSQVTIPEKAAVTIGIKFPSPKSPISGLYLVGTDTDMRSMGITRASYSVIEALKFIKKDGFLI